VSEHLLQLLGIFGLQIKFDRDMIQLETQFIVTLIDKKGVYLCGNIDALPYGPNLL